MKAVQGALSLHTARCTVHGAVALKKSVCSIQYYCFECLPDTPLLISHPLPVLRTKQICIIQ